MKCAARGRDASRGAQSRAEARGAARGRPASCTRCADNTLRMPGRTHGGDDPRGASQLCRTGTGRGAAAILPLAAPLPDACLCTLLLLVLLGAVLAGGGGGDTGGATYAALRGSAGSGMRKAVTEAKAARL